MAINFYLVVQVNRFYLEENVILGKGRLKNIAHQHYRERIAQYYRRYPYDEWYSFKKEEFSLYDRERGPVEQQLPGQKKGFIYFAKKKSSLVS